MRAEFVDSVNGPWSHKDHLREGRGRPGSVRGSNSLSMQGREPARNEEYFIVFVPVKNIAEYLNA